MALPPLTVFDTETTGMEPKKGHRIIEIAAAKIVDGVIADTFDMLVNPERPVPIETKQIHRITDDELAHAATIMTVLPQFLEFAKGSVLIAQNAAFDMAFLEAEKEFCWGYIELPECLCTMRLSQNLFPQEARHNLDAICRRLSITVPLVRHRAMADVDLTAQALLKMIECGKIGSLDDLRKRAAIEYAALRN
jgi:DNA polymerase-3 subunit epsilon